MAAGSTATLSPSRRAGAPPRAGHRGRRDPAPAQDTPPSGNSESVTPVPAPRLPEGVGVPGGERTAQRGERREGREPCAPPHRLLPLGDLGRGPPAPPPAGPDDRAPGSAPTGAPTAGPTCRGPTMREARTSRASVSSVALKRGASRWRSMSRNTTAAARRTRCSTASVPTRTGVAGISSPPEPEPAPARAARDRATAGPDTSPTSTPSRAATSSRSRDTPARSVFMRSCPQAAQTRGRSLPQRGQRRPVPSAPRPRRRSCTGPARRRRRRPAGGPDPSGRRSTPGARAARPLRVVEHAAGQAHELFGEHAAARVGAAAVHPLDGRPAGPLRRDGKRLQRRPALHHGRRAGRGDDAGAARPPGPFGHHVDRAVGRRALLPVGLVVGIEHECGRQLGKRGPGRGPAPDHDRPTGARRGPVRRGRIAPPDQAPAEPLGPADRGNQDEHPAGPGHDLGSVDHRQHQVDQIGGRRDPQHGGCPPPPPARATMSSKTSARQGPPVAATARPPPPTPAPAPAPAGNRRTGPRRRRHAEEERDRAGPAPGRPLGQLEDRGRRAPARPALQRRGARRPRAGVTSSSTTQPPTRRPCRATRTRVPTTTSSVQLVGNGVVEELGQRGHVGAHAHEPPAGRGDGDPAQRGDPGIRDPGRNAGRRPAAWLPT